ncbi:hypothetical protein P2W68_02480 [Chryseobacterium arthrosphaerae]|uniref:hypothetical protein n=1 Tax=Chryseobacterium arthrosphaerae TaxID=651561 RepID=UPI0023E21FE1|nr:hypothetical protein [Chryseobacterium arthrosphaerae]WES98486.1 hypothetical protein P2W68_02480 [Chryseobacterium arthrosphaerae]
MKKKILPLIFLVVGGFSLGQVGINTINPGSTLTVNGSIATKYRLLTGSDTATATDQYLDYKGSSDITLTLPAAQSGSGNFGGRIYEIRNGSTSSTITIKANGSETIDQQIISSNTFTIPAGYAASIKSSGLGSGATWVLTLLGSGAVPTGASATINANTYVVPQGGAPTNSFSVTDTSLKLIPNTSVTLTTPSDKVVWVNFLLGLDDLTSNNSSNLPYIKCEIFLQPISTGPVADTTTNQTLYATGITQVVQQFNVGSNLQFNLSGVLNVPKGSYNIYVRMVRWFNNGQTGNQTMGVLSSSFSSAFLN